MYCIAVHTNHVSEMMRIGLAAVALSFLKLFIILAPDVVVEGASRYRYSAKKYRSYTTYRSYRSTYRGYTAVRYGRTYSSWGAGRKYYYYYNLYFYLPYTNGYHANKKVGKAVSTCKNYEANENGTAIGVFACPLSFEPSDFRFCCGEKNAEYCCNFWDNTLNLVGVITGSVVLVFALLFIGACIGKWYRISQKKKNKALKYRRGRGKVNPIQAPQSITQTTQRQTAQQSFHNDSHGDQSLDTTSPDLSPLYDDVFSNAAPPDLALPPGTTTDTQSIYTQYSQDISSPNVLLPCPDHFSNAGQDLMIYDCQPTEQTVVSPLDMTPESQSEARDLKSNDDVTRMSPDSGHVSGVNNTPSSDTIQDHRQSSNSSAERGNIESLGTTGVNKKSLTNIDN